MAAATRDPRPYRLGVGAMLINRDGRVFVGQRSDASAPAWQMPQGGIDGDESPREAVRRELREEIGTDKAEIIAETEDWLHYDLPANVTGLVWGGRYRGQKQKWFALRFTGHDDDIDIAANDQEFTNWKWTEMDSLPKLIVPFKRQLYRDVILRLGPCIRRALPEPG